MTAAVRSPLGLRDRSLTLSALCCRSPRRHYRMWTRDGPKFSERRNSAEEFGRMFGSATCDYSAGRPNFGKDSVLLFGRFALAAHIDLKSLCLLLVTI